ncbi:F-box/FBD/LRR-repeat protein At1g13570-like [Rosa rugosa]|uniref:F-box/FBD/LRR-repeat protein At1g13570-like n=1 Tax=Rosa rugosa TaxID=74645 RepID=UPI002B409C84|nr:F-box/FBD/LRR-repeat protein At1g13570-like [Rosa rugosa]
MEKKFDRLSNLPFDVLEQILSCLPIKDAVKTSVLSSNWRYKTATLPNLVFDDHCISGEFLSVNSSTIVNIVDHVLSSHIGPIHKFRISHPHLQASHDIDRWILHLSTKSIREFSLEILTWRPYSIPPCLFSCQDIVHLELYHCLLKLPSKFKGFENLKSMDIQRVRLSRRVLEKLIIRCPLLERLTLANCDGFSHFKINAPNLRILDLEGKFEDFILENTSNLAEVCIDLDFKANQKQILDCNSSNLLKFFADLPNIRKLRVQNQFIKYLAVGPLPEKLPEPCRYLEFLSVCVSFSDLDEILTLLGLLRSSPALKELEILVCKEDNAGGGEMYSGLHDNVSCQFTQLQLVKITGISVKAELDFIKFLLLSSPVLKTMTVTPTSVNDFLELVGELLGFRCASASANIIYLEP